MNDIEVDISLSGVGKGASDKDKIKATEPLYDTLHKCRCRQMKGDVCGPPASLSGIRANSISCDMR